MSDSTQHTPFPDCMPAGVRQRLQNLTLPVKVFLIATSGCNPRESRECRTAPSQLAVLVRSALAPSETFNAMPSSVIHANRELTRMEIQG